MSAVFHKFRKLRFLECIILPLIFEQLSSLAPFLCTPDLQMKLQLAPKRLRLPNLNRLEFVLACVHCLCGRSTKLVLATDIL